MLAYKAQLDLLSYVFQVAKGIALIISDLKNDDVTSAVNCSIVNRDFVSRDVSII